MDGELTIDEAEARRPKSLEAEQAVLGAILADNATLDEVDMLKIEHFYDPVHARIYQTIKFMVDQDRLADEVTVKRHFENDGSLDEIGGVAYISTLWQMGADRYAAAEYAKIIIESAERRQLIDVGERMVHQARTETSSKPSDIQEEAEDALANLNGLRASGSTRMLSFREAAYEALDDMDAAKTGHFLRPTGFPDLDSRIGGYAPGELIILAGRPGMGKTLLGGAMCARSSRRALAERTGDEPVSHSLFVAIEQKASRISTRMISAEANVQYSKMRKGTLDMEEEGRARSTVEEINGWPLDILDMPGATVPRIHAYTRRLKRSIERKNGRLDFIVVDYLQKLKPHTRRGGKTEEIGDISNALKEMARDLDVCVVCPAQVSREVQSASRKDFRPTLADLKWSGEIEQDADIILGLFRPAYYAEQKLREYKGNDPVEEAELIAEAQSKTLEAIVLKNREGECGTVNLYCDPATGYIDSLARGVVYE